MKLVSGVRKSGGKKVLYFELLGSFSYGDEESRSCGSALKAGRKALSFLQYLIVNHDRNISSEELIERFWTERSQAPANALRNMLFKVRNLLKQMFPGCPDLLLTLPGCYVWNPDVRLELDTERLERACLEARKSSGEEQLRQLLLAVSFYRGDFLSANDSEWALTLRQYYRVFYVDVCRTILPLLHKKESWIEILEICEQGYKTDFAVEEFTVYAMQALIALGQPEQAIEKYEMFRESVYQEFGISPGSRVEQLYILAVGLRKKDMGIPDIFRLVCEEDPEQSAFFCTFEMFQNFVALEKRHLARSGQTSSLAIVSLGNGAVPDTDVRRLERVLLEQLRAGDPVARLEAGSYIFMLTGAGVEHARLVISRIDRTFHKTYRRSRASITYHISALPSEKKSNSPPALQ